VIPSALNGHAPDYVISLDGEVSPWPRTVDGQRSCLSCANPILAGHAHCDTCLEDAVSRILLTKPLRDARLRLACQRFMEEAYA
jgi:hypothetical protein